MRAERRAACGWETYVGGPVGESTGSGGVRDRVRGVLDVVSAVVDTLAQRRLTKDRSVWWWRCGRACGREVLFASLLEGICTRVIAELHRGQWRDNSEGTDAYARRFVHVNPSTVDVQSSLRTVEHLELVVPVAIAIIRHERHEKQSSTYS